MLETDMNERRLTIFYCRFCERLRIILLQAPWSSFDLIVSSIVFWLGVYFTASPGFMEAYSDVFKALDTLGGVQSWGALMLVFGSLGVLNVLWLDRPRFLIRLVARMGVAFSLVVMTLNHINAYHVPPSTVTYAVLSVSALWSVWRTKSSGR